MKQIALLYYLLFFFSFCVLAESYEKIVTQEKTSPLPSLEFLIQKHSQEGFDPDTLILTSSGFKKIKNITTSDRVIDYKDQAKKVLAITRFFVEQYIKFVIDDIVLYTGCDQIYYTYPEYQPIRAKDIQVGDFLYNTSHEYSLVTNTELIEDCALFYYLTVEDHVFCITSDNLHVHNAEFLINGFSSIPLGFITITHPVVATMGATIALSVIAHKSHQAYLDKDQNNEKNELPVDIILAERYYYLQRSSELKAIKQELIDIKKGLESIQALHNDNFAFTYFFLKQINLGNMYSPNPLLDISAKNEIALFDKQKENLRIIREHELGYLEQEIVNLQFTLAFHINELMEQLSLAENEFIKAQKEIGIAADLWNKHRDHINESIAIQTYKAILLDDHLLNNFDQKMQEVKMVSHYYTSCINSLCIKQSTNIIDLFEQLTPIITEYNKWSVAERRRMDKNIFDVEKYFINHGVPIAHIKQQIKNQLEKNKNRQNAQIVSEANDKLEAIVIAGSPQKDPKKNSEYEIVDNNKKYPNGIYKDASYHHKNSKSGKSPCPDNGQHCLDFL